MEKIFHEDSSHINIITVIELSKLDLKILPWFGKLSSSLASQ